MYFENKDILVLGAGASGIAASRLATAHHAHVTLFDDNFASFSDETLQELAESGISIATGGIASLRQFQFDMAVVSPGVPLDSPAAIFAKEHTSALISELAFGASFIQAPILAVTGTNGKTTTVEMLAHVLASSGRRTVAAGNIGLPLSQVALQGMELDAVVAEVSSFQLELSDDFRPFAAALLNVTPDHLNRHCTMEHYRDLKLGIFKHVENPERRIVRASLGHLLENCTTFSADANIPADFGPALLEGTSLPFQGQHNMENALAAIAMAATLGIPARDSLNALSTFRTGHHRLETVASGNGIEFIDDSKATNVDALIKALETLRARDASRPIALIAGGVDKGCSLEEAIPMLETSAIAHIAIIGSCAPRLAASWGHNAPCEICATMREAVDSSVQSLPAGGIVLLSPACASQDMFKDYAERGDFFAVEARHFCAPSNQKSTFKMNQ